MSVLPFIYRPSLFCSTHQLFQNCHLATGHPPYPPPPLTGSVNLTDVLSICLLKKLVRSHYKVHILVVTPYGGNFGFPQTPVLVLTRMRGILLHLEGCCDILSFLCSYSYLCSVPSLIEHLFLSKIIR